MTRETQVLVAHYQYSTNKRLLDIAIASTLLVVAVPMIVIVAITIVLTSGIPIIFSQKRLGKDQQTITVYKFRTMHLGAETQQQSLQQQNIAPKPFFKVEKDPRFTAVGYLLSHTGLDELPQLINILRGEMSLVGPRPLPIHEGRALPQSWVWRWQVKPGLFSFWVLSPHRYQSLNKWQELEKQTLQISSTAQDLSIITTTLIRQSLTLMQMLLARP